MNALTTWLSHGVAERLGWTLLHSLWQATLVAAVLAIVLRFLARSSAQLRYAIACVAMIAMALLPAATGGLLSLPSGKIATPAAPREQVQQLPAAAQVETLRVSVPPIQAQTPSEPAYERPWRDVAVERLESALPYAVSVWLAGVLLFSVRHLLAWTRLRQLRHRQVRPADANLCDGLSTMTKRLGIQRAVRLVESGLVQVPTVIGWLRPMILLPACAATGLPADQLEALLLHELAHVRRYDYLVNLAQAVLETLGFYHPAVWWVSNRIRVERENCCDDVAARALGDNLRYAKALASMEDLRTDQPGLAMAASGGSLLARIRRLVGRSPNEGSSSTWAPVLVVGLLLLVAAIPVGLAIAEDYTGPTNDLERAVLKGFAENRDKFTCGVLRWTYTMVITDMGDFPVPVGGLKYDGDCRMWWDGDKFATRSTENRMGRPSAAPAPEDQTSRREEDGTFLWIDPLESSDVYTSDLLDRKSPQRAGKNSLMGATHWRGWDSLDRRIIDERRRKGIVVEWATTDIEERTTIRRTVKDRDTGDYRIEHYDPARGYGLVRRESFTAEGRLRSSQTVRLQEIAAGAWFPVEIVTEAFRVKDASAAGENLRKTFRLEEGDSSSISRAALDLEQCSFNDRSALPDGIFEEQPRLEQRELQQILQEIQRKQTSAQAEGSTARTQEPRTVAERFLVAATRGNTEEADKWTISGRYSKVPVEWLNGYDMRVVAMIADDQEALAVTSTIRLVGSVGSIGSLTLPLTQSGKNTWLICAADLESPKGVGRKVEQFLREHPAAIMTLTSEVGTAKVVHFPADRSLGVLHTRERDFPTDSYTTSLYWRKLGEARGDVTVPAGKALRLDVDDNALRAGSPFAALQPDDIQMLDLSMCKDSDDSVLTDIARLRGLKALDLTVTTVTGDGLDHLREIPDLRWLSLASTPLNDEGAAHLASLGSLEYLNLRYTKITDAAMAHVGGLRGLKWLSLDGTAVGDEGMAMLKASTSLQSLSLWNCKITDEGLGHLDGLVNLTELDLVATQITDKGLAHLAGMRKLRRLRLGHTGVMGEGLASLRDLDSLEYLELPDNNIADEHLVHLGDLDRLKKLYVLSDASMEHTFKWLKSMASPLEELQTGGQGITDDAAAAIADLSLKSLWIQRAPLTDDGLAQLANSREPLRIQRGSSLTNEQLVELTQTRLSASLEKLRLMQVNITGPGLAALKRLPRLKELALDGLYIGEGEFTALGDLKTLRHLAIGSDLPGGKMAFSDQDLAAIANIEYLRSLSIVSDHLTDAGLQHLSGMRLLEDLRLSGEGITDAGLTHLEVLSSLKTLSLAGTRVTRNGVERLRKTLPGLECRL